MKTTGKNKIKHRNLVPLLGFCKIEEKRLRAYEYMKWGSQESVLHERTKVREGTPVSRLCASRVLLELLSGKRPIDPSECGDDNYLVGWAKQRPTMIQVMAMFKEFQMDCENDFLDGLKDNLKNL
ncbi:hypothetical protein POM88_007688 [Heracleum sosnowskyi]|uniref:Uncharacterized protein n=1 Tax=Heracleum sosnowskyi TaxID=360622 RepID=A0AAD8J8L0_9APIA|nr:hypothetical protein POM88_007688 [Heracleum sosnowskyi]